MLKKAGLWLSHCRLVDLHFTNSNPQDNHLIFFPEVLQEQQPQKLNMSIYDNTPNLQFNKSGAAHQEHNSHRKNLRKDKTTEVTIDFDNDDDNNHTLEFENGSPRRSFRSSAISRKDFCLLHNQFSLEKHLLKPTPVKKKNRQIRNIR